MSDREAGVTSPSTLYSEGPHASAPDHSPPRSSGWVDDSGRERRERRGKGGRESRGRRRGGGPEESRGASDGERGGTDVNAAGGSRKPGRRRDHQMRSRSLPSTLRGREGGRREDDDEGAREERRRTRRKAKDLTSERENGLPTEGDMERGRVGKAKRDGRKSSASEVVQRAPFSFLMPLDNDNDGSDAESARSFSEVSVSAASISFSGSQWPRDNVSPLLAPGSSTTPPGPWLVPSPHKLSQVLEGKRMSRNKGGLWS